jgi:hypothetical protein
VTPSSMTSDTELSIVPTAMLYSISKKAFHCISIFHSGSVRARPGFCCQRNILLPFQIIEAALIRINNRDALTAKASSTFSPRGPIFNVACTNSSRVLVFL